MFTKRPRMPQGGILATAKPRVLLVGPDIVGGGGERHFLALSRYLYGGNTDVSVLRNSSDENHTLGRAQCLIDLNWRSRFSYPRIIRRLRKQFNNSGYDCCIGFGLFPSILVYLASRKIQRSTRIISMEITRPIESMKRATRWRQILYTLLRRIAYRGSDLFLANSLDGVQESIDKLGVNGKTARRVPNIIDARNIDREKNKPNPIASVRPYIICVSRLVELKRVNDVLIAFARSTISSSMGLVIVGNGPLKEQLMLLAESLGIRDRVVFTGHVKNPFPILNEASVFVTAAEYEGFSNSVLEAMFCDVPVITSLCSTDAQEMCDQGAAVGFEIGDQSRLAEHITAITSDKTLSGELVRRARDYRAPHSLENAIPVYEDLIGYLLYGASETQIIGSGK
jgi:glycosyltransferase involved in cell wall biosynthesis